MNDLSITLCVENIHFYLLRTHSNLSDEYALSLSLYNKHAITYNVFFFWRLLKEKSFGLIGGLVDALGSTEVSYRIRANLGSIERSTYKVEAINTFPIKNLVNINFRSFSFWLLRFFWLAVEF